MNRPRLLIADDNQAIRYLLKLLAEADCEIVGEAGNGQEALDAAEQLRPDLLLLDISMPGMSGLEAVPLLRERMPELRIILTSQHAHRVYVDKALSLGSKATCLNRLRRPRCPWPFAKCSRDVCFAPPAFLSKFAGVFSISYNYLRRN